jgi:arylsulfatase A-like enzyme
MRAHGRRGRRLDTMGNHYAEFLSAQGYTTGMWGKWQLGSAEERLPTHQGFDEWYGIPRTYDGIWQEQNGTEGMWPGQQARVERQCRSP